MNHEENSQAKKTLESAFVAGAVWAAGLYGKQEADIEAKARAVIETVDKERQDATDKYLSLLTPR